MIRKDEEFTALSNKLDDLSRRIDARKREFEQTGEFSDAHEALIRAIRQRHDELKAQVDDAAQRGTKRALVRAEIIRDNSSIFDDLLQLQELLDAEALKKHDATHE